MRKLFMYISARNLCFDRLKRKRAEKNYMVHYLQEMEENAALFYKEVMRQETFRLLHEVIDRLPVQTRQVILLCMEGKNNAEAGEILGISVNSVKTLKELDYATLRENLSRENLILLTLLLRES